MTRIEQVLSQLHIKVLSRKGKRAWALCPFHDDVHASWFIRFQGSRVGQHWCFSCKNGGGLLSLVMHIRVCDVDAAKDFLRTLNEEHELPKAKVQVIQLPPTLGRKRFRLPPEVIFEPFTDWVKPALRYAKSRGITSEEAELFKMGYAVDGRLAGRIIFPWLTSQRVPAGYSARTFVNEDPKYQTPDPSEHPDRTVMFGEHLWGSREAIAITEGALNGIGINRVFPQLSIAALGGSDVDPVHIIKLSTFKHVLILTDPDPAGNKAASALSSALGRYTKTTRILLPEGQDVLDVGPEYLYDKLSVVLSTR